MRRSARFTADMEAKVQAQVGALKDHLVRAQKELQRARNAAAVAISVAEAAGADALDVEALRSARAAIDASAAADQMQQLEDLVMRLLPRTAEG